MPCQRPAEPACGAGGSRAPTGLPRCRQELRSCCGMFHNVFVLIFSASSINRCAAQACHERKHNWREILITRARMDIVRRSYLGEHILSLLTKYFYLHPTKILVSSRINVKTYLMRFHPSSSQAMQSCGNKQQWFYKGNCAHFRMLMTHAAPQAGCGTAGVMLELTCESWPFPI